MLAFSNYIFGEDKLTIRAFAMLWLYAFVRVTWLIIHGNFSTLFSIVDPLGGMTRLLIVNSGLDGGTNLLNLDPNILGLSNGMGVILSLLFLMYRKDLYKFIPFKFVQKQWFLTLLIFITVIEFWFTIRGLSRGIILAVLSSFITYLFVEKRIRAFVMSTSLVFVIYFVFNNIVELFLMRFRHDDTGGGRFIIWEFIWDLMVKQGTIWFGAGLNYPWTKYWYIPGEDLLGTHSSWVSILLVSGLFGILLMLILIIKSSIINYKSNSVIGKIKLIVLSFVIVSNASLGPLYTIWGWILFTICISNNININLHEHNRFSKTNK
jgi:hypothetical protein